jgi:hypothetical protein
VVFAQECELTGGSIHSLPVKKMAAFQVVGCQGWPYITSTSDLFTHGGDRMLGLLEM